MCKLELSESVTLMHALFRFSGIPVVINSEEVYGKAPKYAEVVFVIYNKRSDIYCRRKNYEQSLIMIPEPMLLKPKEDLLNYLIRTLKNAKINYAPNTFVIRKILMIY